QPLQVSWGWPLDRARSDERNDIGSTARIYQLEFEGTRDPCAWLAIPAAIDFQEGLGWENIRQRNAELVCYVRRRIGEDLALPLWTPTHPELHGFLTAFRLPAGVDGPALHKALMQRRIEAPIVERPYSYLVRVSTHFYNTRAEIDYLAAQLPELVR